MFTISDTLRELGDVLLILEDRNDDLLHPAAEVVQSIGVDVTERKELTKVIVLGKSQL